MIRKTTAVLKASSLTYEHNTESGESLASGIPNRKCMLEALATCDSRGKFLVKECEENEGKRAAVYKGRITEIFFLGKRKLTRAELKELPFEPDDKFETESVAYSFRQWYREGSPMKLKLERTEEYYPPFV